MVIRKNQGYKMTRIIVIDDEEDIRNSLKEVLGRAGYDVDVAASSDAGLDILRDKGAELVITDIIMPGKDGVDTVYQIRMEFPNTRVIVISGGGNVTPMEYQPSAISTTAYLASANAAGADVTLAKPFDRGDILNAVREPLKNLDFIREGLLVDFNLNLKGVKSSFTINNQHVMRFDPVNIHENTFDLRWVNIHTANDQHVIRTATHTFQASMSTSTDAWLGDNPGDVTSTVTD